MRRLLASVLLASAAIAGCGSGDDTAATSTTVATIPATTPTTAAPAPSTTRPVAVTTTTTIARVTAATAVIEPHQVAGLPLGANKTHAIAVLGAPTRTGQEMDG